MDRLSNKIERLQHALEDINPDILVLTEHGLKQDEIMKTHTLGYSLIAEYSRIDYQKGGVAIYKNINFKHTVKPAEFPNYSLELNCEITAAYVKSGSQNLHIIGIYRTQGQLDQSLDIISQTLGEIPTWRDPVVIVGDIDIDTLKPNRDQVKLNEVLLSHNINQMLLPPTRITPVSKSSIAHIRVVYVRWVGR